MSGHCSVTRGYSWGQMRPLSMTKRDPQRPQKALATTPSPITAVIGLYTTVMDNMIGYNV